VTEIVYISPKSSHLSDYHQIWFQAHLRILSTVPNLISIRTGVLIFRIDIWAFPYEHGAWNTSNASLHYILCKY